MINRTKKDYSHQILIILKNNLELTEFEKIVHSAYQTKWSKTHNDPDCSRLHTIILNPHDKSDDVKFNCLKLIDQHSRITFIGHYHLNSDYFYYDEKTKFHYKMIVDIIRHNVNCESVLLKAQMDIQHSERALRLTFIMCHVGVKTDQASIADKMFAYATNHSIKPLRIEMTAPLMFCGPFLCSKNENFNFLHPLSEMVQNTDTFHKRYGTLPYHSGKFFLFSHSAGLLSYIFPQYRPGKHKKILKIDAKRSVFGDVKSKTLKPEDEDPHYYSANKNTYK